MREDARSMGGCCLQKGAMQELVLLKCSGRLLWGLLLIISVASLNTPPDLIHLAAAGVQM
jgi:hypothetical protein